MTIDEDTNTDFLEIDDDVNNAYKYGFDLVTEAVLNREHNHSKSLEKSLRIAMDYMCASSISLYRRDINNPDHFNRLAFVSSHSGEKFSGIADSCIANYVSRVNNDYKNANFDINYSDKKIRIDILPVSTLGNVNSIIIVTDNDLTKPQLFNEIMQRSLETVLTNRDLLDEIEQARVTDSLTGIKNREGYNYRISELFKNGTPSKLTYTIADLFRLKTVNDEISHVAGDDYIRSCAESLHTYFRRKDGNHIYRIGGDEFIILSERMSKEVVEANIKKSNIILRKKMHKYSSNNKYLDFIINYGSAELGSELNNPQALYRAADEELSINKKKIYLEAGYERRR